MDFASKHMNAALEKINTVEPPYLYYDEPQQCDLRSLDQLLKDCTVIPVKTAPTETKQMISSMYLSQHLPYTT